MKNLLRHALKDYYLTDQIEWLDYSAKINGYMVGYGYLIGLHWEVLKNTENSRIYFIYTLGGEHALFNIARDA